MKFKKIHYVFLAAITVFSLVIVGILSNKQPENSKITPTDKMPQTDLITYTNTASKENIIVDLPFPRAVTGKAFSVIGKARGSWYFEASFPVKVLDANGNALARGIAQAQSDWMTADFVPFKADIKIPDTYIGKARLVLEKDNPSGLKENNASMSFDFTIEY